jgi:hypothetical protein
MGLLLTLRKPNVGTALDIRASVGTSTSPTSTGTKAVTGVGFQPKVVMPFTAALPVGTAASQQSPFGFGVGVSPSNRAAIGVNIQSGVTTSNTERSHTNANILTIPLLGSINDFLVSDLSTLGSDGFTLNWSVVEATERVLNHICLGGADLEVSLTQHQMNATNSPQSFAHGLSGAPTGLLFFGIQTTSAPAATLTNAAISIGMWAGSNQFGTAYFSDNAVTTTATRRTLYNTASLVNFTAGVTTRTMSVSSVDSTNVNCTYPITTSSAAIYFFMLAIRGAKCQTGTFNHNGSLSPLTINTTGITPKLFLPVFVPIGVDSVNTVLNDLVISIGACDGVNNVSCGITDQNSQTTTNARRFQSSTTLAEHRIDTGVKVTEMTASFSGESIILNPTTMTFSTYGQGCYMVIGA